MLERVDVHAANANPVYRQFCAEHRRRYELAGEWLSACPAEAVPPVIVDAACGTGHGYEALRGHGTYHGLDCDGPTLAAARERYPHASFHLVDLDGARPFGDLRPDVIVSFETAEHLRDPWRFLGACHAALPRGGRLLFSAPTSLTMDFDPYHRRDWDATRWRDVLAQVGFRIDGGRKMGFVATFSDFRRTTPTTWRQQGQVAAFLLRHPRYLADRLWNWGVCNRFTWSSQFFLCRKA
jgi:SAM-dependent methyltransferase